MACLHETEWDIVRYFGDMIDEWDRTGSYDSRARQILSGLLKINVNSAALKTALAGPLY